VIARDITASLTFQTENHVKMSVRAFARNLKGKGFGESKSVAYSVMNKLKFIASAPWEDGFLYLQWYCEKLKAENKGTSFLIILICMDILSFNQYIIIDSVIELETEVDETDKTNKTRRFRRLFIMLGAQAHCASRCKSVISYDGGFLKDTAWDHYQVLVSATLSQVSQPRSARERYLNLFGSFAEDEEDEDEEVASDVIEEEDEVLVFRLGRK